jgi:hypothetical protein
MRAKLIRAKLKPGSRQRVLELIAFMKENRGFVRDEMRQKNYFWDSVFSETVGNDDFILIICKSPDWSETKQDEEIQHTPFREYYLNFKKDCWAVEHANSLDDIWCPDQELRFE